MDGTKGNNFSRFKGLMNSPVLGLQNFQEPDDRVGDQKAQPYLLLKISLFGHDFWQVSRILTIADELLSDLTTVNSCKNFHKCCPEIIPPVGKLFRRLAGAPGLCACPHTCPASLPPLPCAQRPLLSRDDRQASTAWRQQSYRKSLRAAIRKSSAPGSSFLEAQPCVWADHT